MSSTIWTRFDEAALIRALGHDPATAQGGSVEITAEGGHIAMVRWTTMVTPNRSDLLAAIEAALSGDTP